MNEFIHSNIESLATESPYRSFANIYHIHRSSSAKRWLLGTLLVGTIIMFLPWTQNIRAKGNITGLRQEQRPQEINSVLAGMVVKWYVKEGDLVKKGDTLLQLAEVKTEYLDNRLLERTKEQITAKQQSAEGYKNKAGTTVAQLKALEQARDLKVQSLQNKMQQQELKIKTDAADIQALNNELNVYTRQIDGAKIMLDSGVLSLTDFERRKVNYQNAVAKLTSSNNKLLQDKQELLNLQIELNGAQQDYADKIAKTAGEQFGSLSSAASTDAEVAKLQNQYASYEARNKLYFITAPQNGQITRAKKAGIGEILKEGEMLVEMVPEKVQYAVEMYINPMDLPLVSPGQKVRFVFDGFPAIVFSGWPAGSFGTFGGRVMVVENAAGPDGKFRVLVTEDPDDRPWPRRLRIGGGASGISLLRDVPIYYELWRNINGFPPEYYVVVNNKAKSK
jgi:multidrug efflux pump subunit AcrA (membrane-fusion protein)